MGKATIHPPTLISLRLRRARQASIHEDGRKVTMQDVADLIGASDLHEVWKYETGRRIPTPERLARIASLLAIDEDEVWLDTYTLKPDMLEFLVTTVEGAKVVSNIRTIIDRLQAAQKPTTRRGVPEGIHIPIYRHRPVQKPTAKKKTR